MTSATSVETDQDSLNQTPVSPITSYFYIINIAFLVVKSTM